MRIYDSKVKKKVDLKPEEQGIFRIYVCGPTVYDYSHLGHARSAISFDLLKRVLMALGHKVVMAKNFTDIDDKIIKRAKEEGKSLKDITDFFREKYLEEMGELNILRADIEPKATEYLEAMGDMVKRLLKNGFAYKTSKGDVYMDVSKDADYGSLSAKIYDETQSRIEKDEEKRDQRDFALWKSCKEGEEEFCYELEGLTKGRPGWHLECSSMIEQLFSVENREFAIDIHGGGADLLFPHHENEACQSRCATKKELAKYWVHNGFVTIEGEKMSKSLKNSFFIKDALEVVSGEVLRFYLISTHYRASLAFNHQDLFAAKKRLDKLYRLKKRVYGIKAGDIDEKFRELLLEPLKDDLNISVALSVIDEFVKISNDFLDSGEKDGKRKSHIVSNIEFINECLGIGGKDAYEYFQAGLSEEQKAEIEKLLSERSLAKKDKNFARADEIRDVLSAKKISLMDTPSGTVWEVEN